MGILKIFDAITRVGYLFSFIGELVTRIGTGGRVIIPPSVPDSGGEAISQDSSNSHNGEEDEKPAEPEAFEEDQGDDRKANHRGDQESFRSFDPSWPFD